VFRTLDDLFTTIARVLDYPAITRARTEEQREIVEQVLREQRTLLILDNLETVDDESLLDFLHELPQPTKALVTTRHRIDVARAIRLTGMEHDDALGLINQESMRKDVALHQEEQEDLWGRTGGMPLAIVWSIGLMGLGGSVESVLRRLSSGQNDIARFCFEESVTKIRGRSAHRLLLALALFDADVSRPILGEVAGLGEDTYGRDQGLAELLQLSLVNKEGDRFDLLPLTRTYALEDLARSPELEQELRNRWVTHLTELARPYGWLRQEGKHFDTLADWSLQEARPDVLLLLLPALLYYYDLMGRWADALSLGKIGLDYAHLIQDGESILFTAQFMSWILNHQGRIHEAASYGASALAVAEQMDSPAWLCSTLQNYSQTLRRRGQFDYALDCCQRALEQLSELDDNSRVYVRADIEYELGKIARDRADWARAVAHFRVARDVFRLDDENPVFNLEFAWGLLSNVGYVAHQMGDLDEAYQTYMRCLGSYRETVGKGDMATLLTRIASVEVQRGHADAARDYAREALEWSRKLGMIQEQAAAEALLTKLAEEP
jgi:LuxR family glucitol operon transcriptional activator